MEPENTARKLAAILAADVVGYSRLMAQREEATLAVLHVCLDIFRDRIAAHGGRVFGGAGDSVVAEFASAVAAVRCAIEIQHAMAQRNAAVPDEDSMQFRIGINVGDVIVEGDNLMGEGINIAARLESVADPGGIAVSADVYHQVRNKVDAGFEDIGAPALKNITEQIQTYRVVVGGAAISAQGLVKRRYRTSLLRHTWRWYWLAAATLVIAVAIWVLPIWSPLPGPSSQDSESSVARTDTIDPEARDSYVKGWESYQRDTPEEFVIAVAHFRRATRLDPEYRRAYAALAATYWRTWQQQWHHMLKISPRQRAWEKARENLEKAMAQPTPLAHQIQSEMLFTNRHFDEAIAEAEKAISLEPNDPLGYIALANALTVAGRADEAVRLIRKAMHLNPNYPSSFLFALGLTEFSLGDYKEAAIALEQATRNEPLDYRPYLLLVASYGHLGAQEQAAAAISAANEVRRKLQLPSITATTPTDPWDPWPPYRNRDEVVRVQSGLRAAGLPDW